MSEANEQARYDAWQAQQKRRLAWLANDQAVTLAAPPENYLSLYAKWQPLLLALQEKRNGEQPLEWRPDQLA